MTTTWLSEIIGQGIAANISALGATGPQQQWAHQPPQWMLRGQAMTFEEFVTAVFPEDSPEKTAFVLRYSE